MAMEIALFSILTVTEPITSLWLTALTLYQTVVLPASVNVGIAAQPSASASGCEPPTMNVHTASVPSTVSAEKPPARASCASASYVPV